MPRYSLHQNLFRARNDRKQSSPGSSYFTSPLESPMKAHNTKLPSLPTPPHSPSPSQPSVVFPTKATPSRSQTLKKRGLSIPVGCRCRSTDDEELPSEPGPLTTRRCPTLRVLKHMRRTGSPSPRLPSLEMTRPESLARPESISHTPSSRSSSTVEISRPPSSVEMGRSAVLDPFPPLLTLPNEGTMDIGLGWTDEFGIMIDTRVSPPRPWSTTFTYGSSPTCWSQASRALSSPSIRDYSSLSTGFLSTNGLSSTLPSPVAVLNAAESHHVAPSSLHDPFLFREGPTIREDAPSVHFQENHETSSTTPPRLGFQLRRSAEDWATAVLQAVGTSVDS